VRIWIDIDNPPQVRYLLPLARSFEEAGCDVVVTARDHPGTFELLESEGVPYAGIGASAGRSKAGKVVAVLRRTRELRAALDGDKPAALVTASRSAVLAARARRIPSFVVNDYEHVSLSVYRLGASHILFPEVIPPEAYRSKGITARRLWPFKGLKEDLSFAGLDLGAIEPHPFETPSGAKRILFRPPAEESHYYREDSQRLSLDVLRDLARRSDAVVLFSPRYPRQVEYLETVGPWENEPVPLPPALPFVPLIKAVDAVVSSGGTMLREAAYLGVPAVSLFRSAIGAVDRHLASIGRLHFVASAADFRAVPLEQHGLLESNRSLAGDVVERVLAAVGGSRR
jgi:predicted glycosyltransferase